MMGEQETTALVVDQPHASALVHGIAPAVVAVREDDPMVTGWRRMIDRTTGDIFKESVPRLAPGVPVTIRASDEWDDDMWIRRVPNTAVAALDDAWGDAHPPASVVVGRAVVEAVVPILIATDELAREPQRQCVVFVPSPRSLTYYPGDVSDGANLDHALPWLPSDLSGYRAVLLQEVEASDG